MQDRYAGDTPDFGKYSFLRQLQIDSRLTLGVNWYRTLPNEVDKHSNRDGLTRHHTKLPHNFRDASPFIYDKLRLFEIDENRRLENIENTGILLNETRFFGDFLSFGSTRKADAFRIRQDWFRRAQDKLSGCELVFLDPDTGPAPQSKLGKAHTKTGPKYAYPDEIGAHIRAGQSVIVIRFPRQYRGGVAQVVKDTFKLLEFHAAMKRPGYALEFPSGRNSLFFVLPAVAHEDVLREAIGTFMSGRLGGLFKRRA